MTSAALSYLQNLWPFSILKTDDLKVSNNLVRRLSIPEQTKQFVFAVREPDSRAVVYILAAQNLSQQSAQDAQCLIKEVQPEAVVVQVTPSALAEIQAEERSSGDDQESNVPTSSFEVLKRCLIDKVNKEQYDNFARCQVLRAIFGVGFYGNFLAAKRVTEEVDSQFLLIESQYGTVSTVNPPGKAKSVDQNLGLHLQTSCLIPGKITPSVYSSSRRFCVTDTLQSQMVNSLTLSLDSSISKASQSRSIAKPEPRCNYEAPPFAQSVYPLLEDLHGIFHGLPAIGKALVSAQKMLDDVSEGDPVDTQLLSEVHNFRIAVEGLRIALNDAARCPVDKMENGKSRRLDFSELPSEEKCHALFAHALKSQARKYGSMVAIVDAGSLAGLRRHWNTSVPPEVADLANQCFVHNYSDGDLDEGDNANIDRKRLMGDKPVVAVGAGVTAVLGASSLSKAVPAASTLVKLAAYKIPVYLQRAAAVGLGKILGPSKLLVPKLAGVGANAEKIRAVAHGMIASAERTSLLAIRTSFYEIMRRRRGAQRHVRLAPWAKFGSSVAACAGLVAYGDRIECAAELIPSMPTIASLGRGLQSLQQASLEVKQSSGERIQEALKSLMYNLKNKHGQ